ncbi:MAG: hypothetical protein EOO39_12250, partial [Cytophagaceae bacterium]
QTVWVGALTNSKEFVLPESGGWQLDHGQQHSIVLEGHWGGRFWGRTGCATTDGIFKCESGDCGGATCDGRGGQPASLAEFLLFDDAGNLLGTFFAKNSVFQCHPVLLERIGFFVITSSGMGFSQPFVRINPPIFLA